MLLNDNANFVYDLLPVGVLANVNWISFTIRYTLIILFIDVFIKI